MKKLLLLISILIPTISMANTAVRETITADTKRFNLLEIGENIQDPWRNGIAHFQVVDAQGGVLFMQEVEISKFLQYLPAEKAVLFQRVGGNAAGWGLYRFDIENNSLNYWDADARELFIDTDTGVIQAHFACHNTHDGGCLDDDIKFYHWPKDKSQLEEFQPK